MKKIKNPIYLYLVIQTILIQIMGYIAFTKYNNSSLNKLFISMDIAVLLSLVLLIKNKILNVKGKILDYIFVPCIVISIIYSILQFQFIK